MKSFLEFVKEKEAKKINESIDTRKRSRIVNVLKRNGIEYNIDYTIKGSEFIVDDIESANDIADALAGKFKVTIYHDRKTRDGSIPVMITEQEEIQEPKKDTENSQQDTERMERIKDNIALIKKDLEKSGESIQKIKQVIQNNDVEVSEKISAKVTLEKLLSIQEKLENQKRILEENLNNLKS